MLYSYIWFIKTFGGGGRKTLFIPGKIKQLFFSMKGLFLWNFFQSLTVLTPFTFGFVYYLLFYVLSVLTSLKKRLDVLSTHRLSPSKGYESDPTLFSIVSNSFHPSPHLESLSKSLFSHFNNIFQERDTLTGVQSVSLIKWSQKL